MSEGQNGSVKSEGRLELGTEDCNEGIHGTTDQANASAARLFFFRELFAPAPRVRRQAV